MKRPLSRFKPMRWIYTLLAVSIMLLSCGLTAFAAEEGSTDLPAAELPAVTAGQPTDGGEINPEPAAATPMPPYPEDMKDELFPADVQTVIENGTWQIVKIYILTAEQNPADIPRDSFVRDGWRYALTDITQKRTSGTDTRSYIETAEINTDTNDISEIIKQLSPTLDYKSEDGYCGLLTLDLSSVKCEAAGYKNSSYTVTATREYPHLSTNDLSLIPKTITDNGRTLELDGVTWEVQHYVNVDYEDIPDSYRAVAKYAAKASKTTVTGYVTTAEYTGVITKAVTGDTVYAAYFSGTEINPAPKPTKTPKPTPEPTEPPSTGITPQQDSNSLPLVPVLTGLIVLAALAGAATFFFMRRNVRIYRDGFRVLAAKDKISAKNPVIDLSPLDGECFGIEIDKLTAKTLNGAAVEVRQGSANMKHKIAYEGNVYRIEADFGAGTIQAIY